MTLWHEHTKHILFPEKLIPLKGRSFQESSKSTIIISPYEKEKISWQNSSNRRIRVFPEVPTWNFITFLCVHRAHLYKSNILDGNPP